MGGFLPLELNQGKEWFAKISDEKIVRVNTGRTAIYLAIKSMGIKKIFVPYYYCPSVMRVFTDSGIEVENYRIDETLSPVDCNPGPVDGIILVNYFGICTEQMKKNIEKYSNIIIDNTQAFFEPPAWRDDIYNIYSCRKFFGVSDGGYLIGNKIQYERLDRDYSAKRSAYLMSTIELGTNENYCASKENEVCIGNQYLIMSELTEKVMKSVNYEQVLKKRRSNFQHLHSLLKDYQRLTFIPSACDPYNYPLHLDIDINKLLVENKIYVPILWKHCIESNKIDSIEYKMSKNTAFLPIDQRYDKGDMEYMANIVKSLIENYV